MKELINSVKEIYRREHREIIESFIGRFNDHSKVLSAHYAIIRKSGKVNKTDLQMAWDLLKKSFDCIITWIEDVVPESKRDSLRTKYMKIILVELFRNEPTISRPRLVEILSRKLGLTKAYTYEVLKRYDQSNSNKSLLIYNEQDNTYSPRRYI